MIFDFKARPLGLGGGGRPLAFVLDGCGWFFVGLRVAVPCAGGGGQEEAEEAADGH